jgi:hypothetical protein
MANIIPGVPVPEYSCSLSTCATLIAQVNCVLTLLQGTTGCIQIQLFGADKLPLNNDDIASMQIMLFNEFDCVVANFFYPEVPTGCRGFVAESLQYEVTGGTIVNEGLWQICLLSACTSTVPSSIFAELRLEMNPELPGEFVDVIGIRCLKVADIIPSKIYKNGCDDGCGLLLE